MRHTTGEERACGIRAFGQFAEAGAGHAREFARNGANLGVRRVTHRQRAEPDRLA